MAVRRGVWLVIVLIVFAVSISAIGMLLILTTVGREPQVSSNSTLVLRIGGNLNETEPGGVLGQFIEAPPTVRGVVEMLRKAKTDRRITSVIVKPSGAAALWGKVQEVRDAVSDFRRSGKPIVAYLEYGGEQEFYLATACDKVFLMPTATLDLTGMASYELFLRGTLDKIGAYPDALHIGQYKTASNTLTEHTYTPAHREMAESLNNDMFEQLVRGIADGRKKSEAEVKSLIDHGPYLPEDALRAGLIDDLAYEDEIDDKVKLAPGKVHYLEMNDYRGVSAGSLGLNRGPRIAVIYAAGIIASGKSTYDSPSGAVVGSDTLVDYLRKARADSSVKAIVLRVDSPGGSAIASDVIWREVLLTKNQKPLIASMSDVAASGGYYISMPAHAEEARDEHGGGVAGQVRADVFTGAAVFAGRARPHGGEHAGHLRRVRREGGPGPQHHAGAHRRHRTGPRVDRTTGEGDRPRRRARRPGPRRRARQTAREDRAGHGSRARDLPAEEIVLRHRPRSLRQRGPRDDAGVAPGVRESESNPGARRATAGVPQRRAARPHAQRLREMRIFRLKAEVQRWTLPEASPLARASTSATDTRLKSPGIVCFSALAATAKRSASAFDRPVTIA
jgi:protease IV